MFGPTVNTFSVHTIPIYFKMIYVNISYKYIEYVTRFIKSQ